MTVIDQIVALLTREDPLTCCWACMAQRLGVSERFVREAAMSLTLDHPEFRVTQRMCGACLTEGELVEWRPEPARPGD